MLDYLLTRIGFRVPNLPKFYIGLVEKRIYFDSEMSSKLLRWH